MKTMHSFGVDFIIRKCKEDNRRALIYARINVDGERKEISLKEHIYVTDWNFGTEAVKGKTVEAKALNKHIDDVRFRIKSTYRVLQESNALITAETIKQAYLGFHISQKGHKLIELLDYYNKIWKPKLKQGSFKNYKTTINYVKSFISVHSPTRDIYLSQLNIELATDFEYYVRNNPVKEYDPCLGNGVGKHIQRFKRIINWAVEIEWLKTNPLEKYSCPLRKSKRKKLTIQELVALQEQSLIDKRLCYVRDLFLFSCYTGLAFVDVIALREKDFEVSLDGTVWCKIYRTKTDGLCPIPLLKSAIGIVDKYRRQSDPLNGEVIFPGITNQNVNRHLKVLREVCNITTPMTFHVARHTFAKTVALKNGVPLETVQMMMEHSKIATTQIYADVDEEKIFEDMTGIEAQMVKKREIVLAARQLQKVNANDY